MRLIALSKAEQTKAPGWFMLVALLALLWHGSGLAQFVQYMSMTPDIVALLPPERQAHFYGTPGWANAAHGVAVSAGLIGSLLLIMRRQLSVVLYSLSLAAVVVQQAHAVLLGSVSLVMPAVILLIAAFLVLLSFKARMKGWTT